MVRFISVVDATAKIPSGILSGNLNQLGDFDLCLSASGKTKFGQVLGKYFLVEVNLNFREKFKHFDDRLHAFRSMQSDINDVSRLTYS